MSKEATGQQPVRPNITVDKELDKFQFRVSQLKMDKMNEILRQFPPPDLHKKQEEI